MSEPNSTDGHFYRDYRGVTKRIFRIRAEIFLYAGVRSNAGVLALWGRWAVIAFYFYTLVL